MASDSPALRGLIESNLAAINRLAINDDSLGKAGVVIAIVDHPNSAGAPCFLLTLRASKMRKHAGQFALPGGKVDHGESAEQAALRELQEELGISVGNTEILGILDDYPTQSGFCITPVVVWVGSCASIKANPGEVAQFFYIPLEELDRENLVSLAPGEAPDRPVFSINLPTIGHQIYAPTAAIIYQFYESAIKGKEVRVALYNEPRFAWK